MIYRFGVGASTGTTKRLITAGLVFAMTIGLPVLGALLTRDNLTPEPTVVAESNDQGSVLGQNTASNSDQSPHHNGSRHASHSSRTANDKMAVRSQSTMTATSAGSQPTTLKVVPNVPKPSAPQPATSSAPTKPQAGLSAEAHVPALPGADTQQSGSSPAPTPDSGLSLEVDALGVVGAEVNVNTNDGIKAGLDLDVTL